MPARSAQGLGVQVAQGAKPNAQFTGNLGHGKVRVRCQLDSSVAELREAISAVAFALILSGSPPPTWGSHLARTSQTYLVQFTPTRSGKPSEYQSARTHRSVHPHPHPVRLWPARWADHASRQNCRSCSGSDWERFHGRPSGVEVPTLHQVFHPTLYRLFRYNSLQDAVS